MLKAGKDRWTLPTMKAGEFPEPRGSSLESLEVTMRGGAFRQIFKRSSFVADDREHEKYTLKGINIEVTESKFCMLATDMNCAAIAESPCSTGVLSRKIELAYEVVFRNRKMEGRLSQILNLRILTVCRFIRFAENGSTITCGQRRCPDPVCRV